MTPTEHHVGDTEHDYGQRLRQAREAAGMSVADVAQHLFGGALRDQDQDAVA